MPRKRDLRPSFFTNEYIAELPFEARLLFAGLWTIADRRGRLEDRPLRIKAALFPYDNLDIVHLLDLIAGSEGGFIQRYEAEGKKYIQIINFEKNQHIHKEEAESTIPAPEVKMPAPHQHHLSTTLAPPEHHLDTTLTPHEHHPNTPSSLILVASSLESSSLETSSLELVASSQKEEPVDVVAGARAGAGSGSSDLAKVLSHYMEHISCAMPPSMVSAAVQEYLDHMEPDVIIDAIDRAAAENTRKWSYVNAILKSRKENRVRNMADVARESAERDRQKASGRSPPAGKQRQKNIYAELADKARAEEIERTVAVNDTS